MPQPNRRQWAVIWTVAAALVLLWPTGGDRCLAVKAVNLLADPLDRLPVLPEPLPMSLGDDADAVTLHDQQEYEYYAAYEGSTINRVRMDLKEWRSPIDPATQRQGLIAVGVLGLLLIWRLSAGGEATPPEGA